MRRPAGTGSVYKRRSDGRWVAALRVGDRRLVRYAKTRKEAYKLLDELKAQRPVRPDPQSLQSYLESWLSVHQASLRPRTAARYRELLAHLPPELKAQRLSDLNPLQLATLYQQLLGRLKPATVKRLHSALHKALADAVTWGLLADNPASKVKPPKGEPYRPALWSPEQAQAFLAAVLKGEAGRYGPLFGFLLGTGCRLGEALALRWSDVDFERGTVRIERSLTQVKGGYLEGPPKSTAGIRVVTLPGWCLELLRAERQKAGSVRVFSTAGGRPPDRSALRLALQRLCRRLGLQPIRIHDLRHLHVSLLLAAQVPIKVVQSRVGHSSAAVTLAIYAHLLTGDEAAAQAIERLAGP